MKCKIEVIGSCICIENEDGKGLYDIHINEDASLHVIVNHHGRGRPLIVPHTNEYTIMSAAEPTPYQNSKADGTLNN